MPLGRILSYLGWAAGLAGFVTLLVALALVSLGNFDLASEKYSALDVIWMVTTIVFSMLCTVLWSYAVLREIFSKTISGYKWRLALAGLLGGLVFWGELFLGPIQFGNHVGQAIWLGLGAFVGIALCLLLDVLIEKRFLRTS